ncbi:serine/threonine-protein kinase [Candidatus Frankia nodulisporulans]|uniref:serine/threonine-protein kinase n=1 Tax=Candidatus Frankia nodulisporulans TaxID=2060052 RepID=UPI0013D42A81|nr:serine/threonine-protein kinase [Candidatus Frankia nodulisporulans]
MSTDPAPVAVAALRLSDPVQVGPHRLLGRLGGGGMGVVYLGDGPLGQVAIKIIRSELADNPNFRVRFQRELQACFRVRGSHTATLLDFDITADPPWIATEFLAAPTLEQQVARHGVLAVADQRRLAAGLADALVSIHGPGLIHRDLKPSNVMWTTHGPIVIDFGVAAVRDAGQLTVTGTLIGTPGWLSPEQLVTGGIDAAADVFAWGGLICYAATGSPPYGQGPAEAIAYRIVHEEPRVDYSRIDEALHELVRQALSREPTDRPTDRPTAAQLRLALIDHLGPARPIAGCCRCRWPPRVWRRWRCRAGLDGSRDRGDTGPVGQPAAVRRGDGSGGRRGVRRYPAVESLRHRDAGTGRARGRFHDEHGQRQRRRRAGGSVEAARAGVRAGRGRRRAGGGRDRHGRGADGRQ